MKLLLQFAASIFLASVRANVSPYHEIVGVGQSAPPFFVGPVYGVTPAIALLPQRPEQQIETVVAGPVTGTTFVEGSSSGPVTVVTPAGASDILNANVSWVKATDAPSVPDDSVLVRGASTGPVTLVAPSINTVAVGVDDNAASARTETKKGVAATSAKAAVAIEHAEESSTAKASANTTPIKETIGIASANAVIGPSVGPIVIAGPTAPPLPIAFATSTSSSITISASMANSSVNATSSAAGNVSDTVVDEERNDETVTTEATESTKTKGSASSTTTSGNMVASATATVNLIPRGAAIAVDETSLSNVVVSTPTASAVVVSGPAGSVSATDAISLLFETPRHPLEL